MEDHQYDQEAHSALIEHRNNLIISLMEMKGYAPVDYQLNKKVPLPKEFSTIIKNPEQEAKILNQILYISLLIEEESANKPTVNFPNLIF